MDDQEQACEVALQLMTVAEALRPSMPRVSDLMDFTAEMIKGLIIAVAVVFDIRSKSRKTRKIILTEEENKK